MPPKRFILIHADVITCTTLPPLLTHLVAPPQTCALFYLLAVRHGGHYSAALQTAGVIHLHGPPWVGTKVVSELEKQHIVL